MVAVCKDQQGAGCLVMHYKSGTKSVARCTVPGTTSPALHPALRVRHGAAGKVFSRRGTPALWPRGIRATGVGNRDLALKPYALLASHDLAPLGGGHDLLGHHVSAALKGCLEGNTCLRGGHQGLTGSRYPTRPDLFFNYPTRPVPKIENDRVAGN